MAAHTPQPLLWDFLEKKKPTFKPTIRPNGEVGDCLHIKPQSACCLDWRRNWINQSYPSEGEPPSVRVGELMVSLYHPPPSGHHQQFLCAHDAVVFLYQDFLCGNGAVDKSVRHSFCIGNTVYKEITKNIRRKSCIL